MYKCVWEYNSQNKYMKILVHTIKCTNPFTVSFRLGPVLDEATEGCDPSARSNHHDGYCLLERQAEL